MPYIQVAGTQHSLRVGETPVGTSAEAVLRVAGPETLGVQAVLTVGKDGAVSIRRAGTGTVRVNGVQLGVEPSPLIHGDKIEVAGQEMLFGDEKKSGGTQMLSGFDVPDFFRESDAAPARPTAATGGRLVSLVDGREYAIPEHGLSLGRDAGCDVVVPGNEVSRRHADIGVGTNGYVVTDASTNGVFVNGERVRGSQLLGRGDVVRIGSEEFRFYADVPAPVPETPPAPAPQAAPAAPVAAPKAPPAPAQAASAGPKPSAPAASSVSASPAMKPSAPASSSATPASSASSPGAPLVPSAAPQGTAPSKQPSASSAAPPAKQPSAPPAQPPSRPASGASASSAVPSPAPAAAAAVPNATDTRPPLATLEVTSEGLLRGRRFDLRVPLVNVGRGPHNDVVLPDDSVSDSHAKLQKREGGWHVVDMGSTNGTYVAGRRIGSETALEPECDLRIGGIKLRFRALAERVEDAKGTRAIAGVSVADARRAAAAAREPHPPVETEERKRGLPMYVWVIALALLGLAVYFFLQGQTR